MIKKLRKLWLNLRALPKTIIFNLKYFPLKDAVKLPVFVSHRVWLLELGGDVIIDAPIKTRMIKLGFGGVGIFDQNRSRSVWQVSGQVHFKGKADIGHGSKISVTGELVLGDDFTVSAESTIVAHSKVEFGRGALLSWDILVMDTDFHEIQDVDGNMINPNMPVTIGDNVWIGCRAMILKGSQIASGSVIAAGTTVTPVSPQEEKAIVGGNPARVLKQNISWIKDTFETSQR